MQLFLDGLWVKPTIDLPTMNTAVVYPGTIIFEGTNISEGRGTTKPFEVIAADFITEPNELAKRLNEEFQYNGVVFRPASFYKRYIYLQIQYFFKLNFTNLIILFNRHGKFAGKKVGGVQIHVTDRDDFWSVQVGAEILK